MTSSTQETTPQSVSTNIQWHQATIDQDSRQRLNGHRSAVLWFTGLSGSGKSTIANAVNQLLHQRQIRSYVLDGDNVRHGLCGDLGFSDADRQENIRRIGEVAGLFVDAGLFVLTAFISPFREDRAIAKDKVKDGEFIEIFVDCPLSVCEERDPKGLYKKARDGVIKQFTGIDSPYEAPENPDLVLKSEAMDTVQCAEHVIQFLEEKGWLQS